MRFQVLGPLTVAENGTVVPIGAPKQRAVLAALLLTPGRVMSVERLIDEVWPDEPPVTAGAALQVYVSGLRKVLGTLVRASPPGYRLEVAPADVDAHQFEALLEQARGCRAEHPARSAAQLRTALALWTGPAFDGVAGGSGVAAAAARLEHLRRAARLDLAQLELDLGRHSDIVADLAAWTTEHPTDEGLARLLMLALHRCGRSHEAVAAFDRLADGLRAGLGVEPDEQTVALARAIRRRDPTVDAVTPAIPAPLSRFIGRRAELDRAAELLGRRRLLTVTGPGGSGKTRFAIELAREVAPAHPAGVYLVELAGAGDEVATRVAGGAGARDIAGHGTVEALVRHLGAGRHLLILDNCERVLGQCAGLAETLLTACAGLRILATSREPLGVGGEAVQSLGGLQLPAAGAAGPDALRSDALRLFLDRAEAARGGARLPVADEPLAVEVCRRLDGLPLAIELSAARLRSLPLAELAPRLDHLLTLLVGGPGPDRHRTMRAAIEWSHDLLDADERALLRRLSVFSGSFRLDAGRAVGADPDRPGPRGGEAVVEVLARLVDRSMVAREGATRYRLTETIREYAAEQLAPSGEGDAARDRHADWYTELLVPPPPVDGSAHAAWLADLTREHDNLRAALAWSLADGGDAARGLTLATSLWWYWWITGQMVEGRQWLARALAADAVRPGTALRGRALRAAAALARNNGDLDTARSLGEDCLRIHQQLGDPPGIIAALNNLSITAQGQHDFTASLEFGYAGLDLAEKAENTRAVAAALNNTAGTLRCLDRLDEAEELFRRALALFGQIKDRRGEAAATGNLAVVCRRRGQLDMARELARSTLATYHELDLAEGVLDAVESLAHLDALTGRPERALRALTLAAQERIRLGAPIFTPDEVVDRDRAEALARAASAAEPDTATLAEIVAEHLASS